ncbi:GntR family transcriptional regulator [Pelagibius sp.]|uniref:GntR family transcriptional regulator n=1 Tax=Pelagibius sp. TaxID=1931238 RepID=UPI003B508C31
MAENLRERIVLNHLQEGERISEVALAEKLGVSRTPLREALAVLKREGLVQSRPRCGTYVTFITADDTAETFQAIAVVESSAGRIAARWITDQELRDLTGLHERLYALHRERAREDYSAVNDEIHRRFVQLTGNRHLIQAHEQWLVAARRVRFQALQAQERWDASVTEHAEILAAIAARDADRAGALIEHHVRETGDFFCRNLLAREGRRVSTRSRLR